MIPKSVQDQLDQEISKPKVGGIISPTRTPIANTLTPSYLGSILQDADQGNSQNYYTLGAEVLERDPHIVSVLNTRTLAVAGLPLVVEAASDSSRDLDIAASVEKVIRSNPTQDLISKLMSAVYYGISAIEIIWDLSDPKMWKPVSYEYREPRHLEFDRETLSIPRLRSAGTQDVELSPYKWIVHTPGLRPGLPLQVGLIRPLLICYAAKRFTIQQMLTFLETMSIPVRVGKFPASMASQRDELLDAVRRIGSDSAAVIPEEMAVEFLESTTATGNSSMFLNNLEYWDRTISKIVLGASMAVDQGSSRAQAQVHDGVRNDVMVSDAMACSNTLNLQLVKPFVDLNFGEQESYPKLRLDTSSQEDISQLVSVAEKFVAMGGELEMSSLRDRLGFIEPALGAKLLSKV